MVAKIAAGEVVERPASVVKELVENAVDAGARRVRISLQRGGQDLIRVVDDGHGIPADQLELALARHATSKVCTLEDLAHVSSLGFRGEALASIAAVSQLELESRPEGQAAGGRIRVSGGHVTQRSAAAVPLGTSVTVRQLFYNVPARQAFQRAPGAETRQVSYLATQLALAHPGVTLTLLVEPGQRQNATAFASPGTGRLLDAVVAAYGEAVAEGLLAVDAHDEHGAAIGGFVSPPDENRPTRLALSFFVNGRSVRSPMLAYAVEEAYHTLLPTGRHPLAVLHITLPLDEVDVNVHPTKAEVRFRHDRRLFGLVLRAVGAALERYAGVPQLRVASAPPWSAALPAGSVPPLAADTAIGVAALPLVPAPAAASGPPAAWAEGEATAPARLRVLGQVGLTYIVAEDATGVFLIDQHSAHERIVYEELVEQAVTGRGIQSQLLLVPEVADLEPHHAQWIGDPVHREVLAELGFAVEPFGDRTWLIRAVPGGLAQRTVLRAANRSDGPPPSPSLRTELCDLIEGIIVREYGEGTLSDQTRWAVACHSAVRAGDPLALEEMEALIARLERCDLARTCPHGRPTMLHLSHAQLAREFGRR